MEGHDQVRTGRDILCKLLSLEVAKVCQRVKSGEVVAKPALAALCTRRITLTCLMVWVLGSSSGGGWSYGGPSDLASSKQASIDEL